MKKLKNLKKQKEDYEHKKKKDEKFIEDPKKEEEQLIIEVENMLDRNLNKKKE